MSNWQRANLFFSGAMLGFFVMNMAAGRPWWAAGNLLMFVLNMWCALTKEEA